MRQTILNNIQYFLLIALIIPNQIDAIISDIISGENKYSLDEVQVQINNNSEVNDNNLILNGLLEIDGEKSFSFFKEYIEKNKDGIYSNLALSKVANYYYTKGLYTQASNLYKILILESKDTENLIPHINYFINSLAVSGKLDSAKYYTKLLKDKYPSLNFNTAFYSNENSSNIEENKKTHIGKTYYVQVGLYENYSNATYNRSILSSAGFLSRIDEIFVGNQTFYALRVGYYSDLQKAENIKRRIRSRLGLTNLEVIESK